MNNPLPYPVPNGIKISDLKAGDTVELHGFDCAQGTVTIEQDWYSSQLFFNCAEGKHWLSRQLDQNDHLVGITIRPDAKIIPITQERIMNLDTKDAGSVSRFFQGIADSVVMASTLPAEVEELRGVVNQLKADVEAYREHNARMDEEITNLRRERQALQDENATLQSQLTSKTDELNLNNTRWSQACSERDRWHNEAIAVSSTLEDTKRERDDGLMKIMELEEKFQRLLADGDRTQLDFERVTSQLNSIRSALA